MHGISPIHVHARVRVKGATVVSPTHSETLRIVLLLSCPDRRRIVSRVSQFIYEQDGNIVESLQHSAVDTGTFFMRVEWDWTVPFAAAKEGDGRREKSAGDESDTRPFSERVNELTARFQPIADSFQMDFQIWAVGEPQRVAIMVSRHLHCLYDLLLQWHEEDAPQYEIVCVISNHHEGAQISKWLQVPFHYVEARAENRAEAEAKQLAILQQYQVDLVVLARYMQILSENFIDRYTHKIINIHHSFLPAFVGAKPYHQAYERGVKIIGATSHYATADLDQGPIIAQDVCHITHSDTIHDIVHKGKNLERDVLNWAVSLHLQRRVYVHRNKTIVFE